MKEIVNTRHSKDKHDIKIIVLGLTCVGKTSISRRLCGEYFQDKYSPTIGAEFFITKHHTEEHVFDIKIWDTAGQERFKSLMPMYYRDTKVAIFVFDIVCESSFDYMIDIMTDFIEKNYTTKPIIYVIGNKLDIKIHNLFDCKVNKYLENINTKYFPCININYFETSAKTGEGIDLLYNFIIKTLLENVNNKTITFSNNFTNSIIINNEPPEKNKNKKKWCII